MIYLPDSNTFSYLMEERPKIVQRFKEVEAQGNTVLICQPVLYELERGLRWRQASKKLNYLRNNILPLFEIESASTDDWLQAAQFWAEARKQGRQLSDMDLLLAAIAHRLDATLVTNDEDFAILSIRRENWEQT